jgi:thiamine-monophosphate kinase|tara:strand:+ start:1076 stop:2053 length:978 start_codon:yes stop_codon:yes gene_type:complete
VLTEFELIKHCFNWPQNNEHIICAVGDDASIVKVPNGFDLVQSIDTQVADVHFPASAPAQLIAQRALRCAISDLAAMGAKPQAFHLALSLPKNTTQPWLESFSSGLRACADEYNIPLIGGDTTSSPTLIITIQVQGLVPHGKALTRDTAQIGDSIWLSGEIGKSAAALKSILANPQAFIKNTTDMSDAELATAYYYPHAQIALGQQLIGLATSAMDISDGLLQDASHIAKASNVCLNFNTACIPLNQYAIAEYGKNAALELALSGGDDYQLLFTAPQHAHNILSTMNCHKVGQVEIINATTNHQRNWVLLDGNPVNNKATGYQHF